MSVRKDEIRGTWEVKFSYRNFLGEKKWVHKRGFEKKSDAVAWENDYKNKLSGTVDMTLNDFVEVYKEYLSTRIRETTMNNKIAIIDKWIVPYLGNLPLNQITNKDIIQWQNRIIKEVNPNTGEKYANSYLKLIHSHLAALLNHAVKFYGLPNNVASVVGNMGDDKSVQIDFWTLEEYKKFSESIMDAPEYYYLFQILYWCGLRIGEALALQLDDIDLVNKTININKSYTRLNGKEIISDPKTRKSKRVVKMPDFLADEINDYINTIYNPDECSRLFNIGKSSINRFLKRRALKVGVKPIKVHGLRHSHVSLLINLGFSIPSISERVGHEGSFITLHYAHMFPNADSNIANSLEVLNKEEGKDV